MLTTDFIRGADLSSLDEVERCGGKFYDNGKQGDAMAIMASHGMNLVRLRLWNDPYSESGEPYGAGTNDFETTCRLAERAKAQGLCFMLDFHYSDFWADPGKQFVPKAWRGLDSDGLCGAVYDFTEKTLKKLAARGISPDVVAIGNEITNGLLWPSGRVPNFDNIARYVGAGIRASRKVLPGARVMIHLDNGGKNELYRNWFDSYFAAYGEDFDIIGLSYYPFWHGKMTDLAANMNDIAERYGKDLIVVETSMGFSLDDFSEYEGLSQNERKGGAATAELAENVDYPMTKDGQREFLSDLKKVIRAVPGGRGRGFVWWEPAWIPVKNSHWATDAGLGYTGEKGPGGNEWANQALFDYKGNALPAMKEFE